MTYEQAMTYINGFSRSGAPVTDLIRFIILMKELGDPQDNFKSVHIAGTNGKGSVCEYISRALRASGKRVGRFTSPYITCIEERIQINGKNISRPAFALLCERVKAAAEKSGFTGYSQFEILCAIGFLYFSTEQVDYAVVETGIGGLLDCTNILDPVLSVITSIGMDHTDILGDTIEKIAAHKAGIIKPSVPCVTSPDQPPEALKVIEDKCREFSVKLVVPEKERLKLLHMDMCDVFFTYKGQNFHSIMSGKHQLNNLMCAIEACEQLGLKYGDIFTGIEKASLPARMERVQSGRTVYFLDGAHNPPAATACAEMLSSMSGRPVYAVIGMLSRKNWRGTLDKLLPCLSGAVFTDDFSPDAVPRDTLIQYAGEKIKDVSGADSLSDALAIAAKRTDCTLIVTGSLYLAAKARELLLNESLDT